MQKGLKWLGEFGLHLVFVGVIIWAWWGIASWYVNHSPVLGVDFFNTVTYTRYLGENFVPVLLGWNYISWSGYPIDSDYPVFHMHLMALFSKMAGTATIVLWYMMGTVLVYLVFGYLTFWEMGKSRGLAVMLAVWGAFSIGVYGALTWGGSLPFFATQAFLPIATYFLARYLKRGEISGVLLAALAVGLAAWGHAQTAVIYILPLIVVAIFFSADKGAKKTFKSLMIFGVVFLLVAYPKFYARYLPSLPKLPIWIAQKAAGVVGSKAVVKSLPTQITPEAATYTHDLSQWNKNNITQLWDKTGVFFWPTLIFVLIVYLVGLLFKSDKKTSLSIFGVLLAGCYYAGFIMLLAAGVAIPSGGWYRVYWPIPFLLGWIISAMWGGIPSFGPKWLKIGQAVIMGIVGVGLGIGGALYIRGNFFSKLEDKKLAYSENSSAWPILVNYLVSEKEAVKLKKMLVPSWLDVNDRMHRLYAADAQVNVWWNSMFDMPMQRGYIDPPVGNDRKGGYFWWDATATNDQLVKVFNVPESIAKNNGLFLADWFGIKYLELGHASSSYSSLSTYLDTPKFIKRKEELFFVDNPKLIKYYLGKGKIEVSGMKYNAGENMEVRTEPVALGEFRVIGKNISVLVFKDEDWQRYTVVGTDGKLWQMSPNADNKPGMYLDLASVSGASFDLDFKYSGLQSLKYYELNDDVVSPIIHPTNAKVLAVVGANNYYESLFRSLGMENLNSKMVIPLKINVPVEKLGSDELKKFDMVMLYGYNTKTNDWGGLKEWVNGGGKLWVETGGDGPQTQASELPDIFPITSTKKADLGQKWEPPVDGFADLTLDSKPWLLSVGEGLKSGATVLIAQKNQPIMARWNVGKGTVIWSGLNLPYHILVHSNVAEGKLLANVLTQEMGLIRTTIDTNYGVDWENPQSLIMELRDPAKGILFREQDYGWKVGANGASLPVYKTGPTYNGYVYVPTQGIKTPAKIKYGVWPIEWQMLTYYIISFIVMIGVIDYVVFGQRLFGPVWKRTTKFVGRWWEKEEEN